MFALFTRAFGERGVFPDHALARNFGAESYVPKNARKGKNEACTLIR